MSLITQDEAAILDKFGATNQQVAPGAKLLELSTGSMIAIDFAITADATSGLTITIPYDFDLRDVIVQCTTANALGTATLRNTTNAISDAMAMAVDATIARAGTLDDTYTAISTTDSINVITNGAADRGIITLIGVRK
jgi:hypothetical protein